MAGTDSSKASLSGGPAIVLVEPQLGENIGMAARAMLNCGLTDLRIVNPRRPYPNQHAIAAAAGADRLLHEARLFATAADAVADLHRVFAMTARPRDMVKPVVTPREAAVRLRAIEAGAQACGVLIGRERTGLTNEEAMLADTLVTAPLNPAYSSLNLAQAVLLIGWEWLAAADTTPAERLPRGNSRPATAAELANLFAHFERELDDAEFFRAEHMRAAMWQNLRNVLLRAGMTEQEVRTMHGVISRLTGRRKSHDQKRKERGLPPEEGAGSG